MKFAIMQHSYEVKFGLHKMWGGLHVTFKKRERECFSSLILLSRGIHPQPY